MQQLEPRTGVPGPGFSRSPPVSEALCSPGRRMSCRIQECCQTWDADSCAGNSRPVLVSHWLESRIQSLIAASDRIELSSSSLSQLLVFNCVPTGIPMIS